MRDAYINSIYKATKKNKEVLCLVGDIGAFLLRHYIKDFPLNYLNLGAAEANMVGIAAGLAKSGKIPFVYTITPFITSRTYEQIKLDVCYNEANVKLVGVGSGISYSTMGSTHHSLEDLAIMRALPNMVILSPADDKEVEEAAFAAMKHKGPVYIRLSLSINNLDYKREKFKIGKARVVKKGSEVAIIATGDMVKVAVDAAEMLKQININSYVINMHTIKPIDEEIIKKLSVQSKVIVTIEEHSVVGGLGSAVAGIISQNQKNKSIFRIMGFKDEFCKEYSKDKMKIFEIHKLSAKHVVKTVRNLYEKK